MNTKAQTDNRDIISLLIKRETKDNVGHSLKRKLHVTRNFIDRLGMECELSGHTGCVNCLEWNESGRMLASASDDLHVILWDPFSHKKLHSVQTGHHGNIFSVKFMPQSGDNILVTGAGDCHIRMHDVKESETTYICRCHTGRIKRIVTAPTAPNMFWSAAEDGKIIQADIRKPHSCSKDLKNVLINLNDHLGRYAEAKCLAINPQRPEILAVGANDPYIRVYDRRMLKPHSPAKAAEDESNKMLPGCVQYFIAGHLPSTHQDYKKRFRNLASTYLTFGADGNELLANLGGEQIYLFDINNKREVKEFNFAGKSSQDGDDPHSTIGNGLNASSSVIPEAAPLNLTPQAYDLKQKANEAFQQDNITVAINLYNIAIAMCPESSILYANRAAAYMKRQWDGDIYAALRDCLETIKRDTNHWKSQLRLARCLFDLHWVSKADKCLKLFKLRFPCYVKDPGCVELIKDLNKVKDLTAYTKEEGEEESPERLEMIGEARSEGSNGMSSQESKWRSASYDYECRFLGHCNTTTDIKECNFFGSENQYVVAGSDDGSFFIWDRRTTNILRVLSGDTSIVNCLQPHPSYCMLATSGIDPVVRLWSPSAEDGKKNEREVVDLDTAASANQRRMNADPFEVMLLNMGVPDHAEGETPIQCRPS